MKQALIVGFGGFLGTIARWLLGGFILHRAPNLKFPLGTVPSHIRGCLLIGRLAGLLAHAIDQATNGSPIRARLRYVGPEPGAN